MKDHYKVGNLIYDAHIYDGMNSHLDDLKFYKRWLPKNQNARILELCCGKDMHVLSTGTRCLSRVEWLRSAAQIRKLCRSSI